MQMIDEDIKLDFRDVLICPKRNSLRSRADADLNRKFKFRNSNADLEGIPIMASNMETTGTFEMASALYKHNCFTAIHKHYELMDWVKFADENPNVLANVAVSAGASEEDFEKVRKIIEAVPAISFLCLEEANAYTQLFVDCVASFRNEFPKQIILAGSVVTDEMASELILTGADIIRVGLGSGSLCTTRKMTGIGYPQLSAIIECADAAHALNAHILSDGGCTLPGDITKAFGAGADFVMLGGMLAGHEQSGGYVTERNGQKFKCFLGTSSATSIAKDDSAVAEYRAPEGETVGVPFKGDVKRTINDILGGIRSACTYTGSAKLEQLSKHCTFMRVTQQTNEIFSAFEV